MNYSNIGPLVEVEGDDPWTRGPSPDRWTCGSGLETRMRSDSILRVLINDVLPNRSSHTEQGEPAEAKRHSSTTPASSWPATNRSIRTAFLRW